MTETLMHYSHCPIGLVREWPYEQNEPRCFGKPVGLWVSVLGDADWPEWCTDNDYGADYLAYGHQVTLVEGARVLRISTPEGIDTFHARYSVQTDFERRYGTQFSMWPIDWRPLVDEFDGIIIAPYQYSRRFSPDWYYGWDCASGCIWGLDAIASLELVPSEVSS